MWCKFCSNLKSGNYIRMELLKRGLVRFGYVMAYLRFEMCNRALDICYSCRVVFTKRRKGKKMQERKEKEKEKKYFVRIFYEDLCR